MRIVTVVALLMSAAALISACGGGGSKSKTATPDLTAKIPATGGTATGTAASGTPGAQVTLTAPTAEATLSDEDATATEAAAQATGTALGSSDVTGGDPNATPQVVSTIPPVRGDGTPVVDPTELAPPDPTSNELSLVVDMDASKAGIQTDRTVKRGDVFRVAVVIVNAPVNENNLGGIAAFNFEVDYDKTKIVAPTYEGGALGARNPSINLDALGGEAAGWNCLPAPEGDLDDPIGIGGDGKPETGQAFISCFTQGAAPASGNIVLATITFTAIASGASDLTLSNLDVADAVAIDYANCQNDAGAVAPVPCQPGHITVN